MTRGVVIFAIDNETTRYTYLADRLAARVHEYLRIPTTILTTKDLSATSSGSRWWADTNSMAQWYNQGRCQAFDLTPYDETLVLDADYVVASDRLSLCWHLGPDMLAPRWAYDVTGLSDYDALNHWGRWRMPMSWATVIYFRKSRHTEAVFDVMHRVQENWQHYRDLYGAGNSRFRNDFALSIAQHVASGYQGQWPHLPWQMASIDPQHKITQLDHTTFRVDYTDVNQRARWTLIRDQDLHVMGKSQLEALYHE